jgi:hypothetical protein
MTLRIDEEAYARALRQSACETLRRWRGDGLHASAQKGGLTEGVVNVLADGPTTAVAIAARLGRAITDIPSILRRLERDGRAERAGVTRNHTNQPVTLWKGRSKT